MRTSRTPEQIVQELLEKAIPKDGCLNCHLTGAFSRGWFRQYVQVGGRQGTKWRATRLVWHVIKGPIEDGLGVLHTCDNPECINIEHLFLGTAQDNADDKMIKGRYRNDPEVGERRRQQTAQLIRPLLAQGLGRYAIAKRLGISPSTVWNYINGPYRDSLTLPSRDEDTVGVGLD